MTDRTFGPCVEGLAGTTMSGRAEEDAVCEHFGCRALRAIAELTREHDAALDDIRTGRQAAAGGDRQAAARAAVRLLALLHPHTAVEEQALFPAMAREHPDHVEVLATEHHHIHAALVDTALGLPDGPQWAPRLTCALDSLRDHMAKEEDGLFPAALTTLSADDWEAVEHIRARVGSTLRPAPAA